LSNDSINTTTLVARKISASYGELAPIGLAALSALVRAPKAQGG
jgi:hypothetical protein